MSKTENDRGTNASPGPHATSLSSTSSPRQTILLRSAEWHAIAALRSSSPLKDRGALKKLVAAIDLAALEKLAAGVSAPPSASAATEKAYDDWQSAQVERIVAEAPELSFGWASKLVNVYVKSLVYISPDFWPQLRPLIHPAVDGMLQDALEAAKLQKSKVGLKDMDRAAYTALIAQYRALAKSKEILLVEIDMYWEY